MLDDALNYAYSLPPTVLYIIGGLIIVIVFSIFKKLIKFALSLAALIILILVIIKFLEGM